MSSHSTDNAAALLAQARVGCQEALGQLLAAYRPYLRSLAVQEVAADLRAKNDPSDLVSETIVEAFRDFPRFSGRSVAEFVVWLESILRHNAINVANRFRHTAKRQIDREVSIDDSRFGTHVVDQIATDSTPSAHARKKEEKEVMALAFKRLPEDYRKVIVLHHREDRPFEEIAQVLGRTEGAVRKLWARALERWQHEVESLYGSP
jgi:RNA polymerase sigma-70 factor, ECF subfamily